MRNFLKFGICWLDSLYGGIEMSGIGAIKMNPSKVKSVAELMTQLAFPVLSQMYPRHRRYKKITDQ